MPRKADDGMDSDYLDIPLFPLPNVTLFPRTILPLHVFEPRYRALAAAALKGDRLIGMALLREGWQKDYFGRPVVFRTMGVGRIVDYEHLADGRYNLVLEGVCRARLIEEHEVRAYRVARVAVLDDMPIDRKQAEVRDLVMDLTAQCEAIGRHLKEGRGLIQSALASHPHPAVIADLLASHLVADPYERQSILEETDPLRRLKLVLVQARRLRDRLDASASALRETSAEEP